jgi:hypothetical protein
VAIDVKCHVIALSPQEIAHKWGLVKYIHVVVATGQPEKGMPDPKQLVCDGF